jgi:hypothetical protein
MSWPHLFDLLHAEMASGIVATSRIRQVPGTIASPGPVELE